MTQANTLVAKLSVAFVAIAMALSMVVPAQAATAEEMQAQIDALMAQLAALTSTPAASTASGCYTFTRSLTIGSQGADVTALQNALIKGGYSVPAGATGYFGSQTAAAVAAWQTANAVSPAAGYFGPVSQAKFAATCDSSDDSDDSDDSTDDSDDSDDSSTDLSGEASLTTFEVADGEDADDVEEGSEDIVVGEFTAEFTDGDAMINRIDLALYVDGGNNGDDDAWDVFQEVSLWVDGEEVGRIDVTDEDNYLDEDFGSLRFSDLDIVAMEDEEVVIDVAVTVNGSVDGVASSDPEDWNIAAGPMRFTDADDVTSTETEGDAQAMDGSYAGTVAEFAIEMEGSGDDLELESSSENPEASTIELSEDDNTEAEIFAFELSAEDSDGDVELNEIVVDVNIDGGASNVDDLVNDFRIEIDGESFSAESYTGTGVTAALTFDIDGDVTIEAEEVATVVLFADFEDMEVADEGSSIYASTTAADIDAEGATDITVGGSAKVGETHVLRTTGLVLAEQVTDGTDSSDSEQVVSGVSTDANYGTMFLTYEVTAFGDNVWVKASDAFRGAASTTKGLSYQILASGSATTSGTVAVDYDIDGADEDNGYFELEAGETYTMTVTIESYNPAATGLYSFKVNSVGYNDTEDTVGESTATPNDATEYVSDSVSVQS